MAYCSVILAQCDRHEQGSEKKKKPIDFARIDDIMPVQIAKSAICTGIMSFAVGNFAVGIAMLSAVSCEWKETMEARKRIYSRSK